ncbi:hypothetical protein [Amycolatopsis sp. FDAARGOS 1241]|uniref:hypothetical protein n=1 Tax=Amycolatopsis sp. FDAARGOS 1241 TaxID=2778070 RepID=UPI0019502BA8|nr:hypothetical protein [Amycolatopsis sp. FDAARGOS 1241]QRP47615.1 hypothetical protein I6J71_06640 [Amycolatopsis sp. FDAARGOS 1241]
MRDAVKAWAVAATGSGVPSTLHALFTHRDPLAATRAAGTLLPGGRAGVVRGTLVHGLVSAGWTAALAYVDRRRPLSVRDGMAAGAAIALLDLEVVGRRKSAIRALPRGPQWLDHLAYGALTALALRAARASAPAPPPRRRRGTSAARSRRGRGGAGPGRRRRA